MKKISLTALLTMTMLTPLGAQEPKLTETEQLKIQILNLQYTLKSEQEKNAQLTIAYGQCVAKSLEKNGTVDQSLANAVVALQKEIEAKHPGYRFDITKGIFSKLPEVEKK